MHDVRTYIYIYIYKKHIYIYDEDFSQLYDKCGARAARQLFKAIIYERVVRGMCCGEVKVSLVSRVSAVLLAD